MRNIVAGLAGIALSALLVGGTAMAGDAVDKAVNENSLRKEGDAVRDGDRHPAEVLRFFEISETKTVVEVNPGGMWYSRILGPLLKEKGHYVGLEHHPDEYKDAVDYSANLRKWPEKVAANTEVFGARATGSWIPMKDSPVADDSVDTVMVVRAMHNWVRRGFFGTATNDAWRMLKPGGVLGVVQHRADPKMTGDRHLTTDWGRWKQAELVAAIESYGFKLEEVSEMNANPKDPRTFRVWNLPPVLAVGDDEKKKNEMRAIGESDRMTLKFRKVARH